MKIALALLFCTVAGALMQEVVASELFRTK